MKEVESGLSAATVDAYSRAVERYLAYCRARRIRPSAATTAHLAEYLRELAAAGLGPAARVQRLTALRLFFAFVVERGLRPDNPAGSLGAPLLGRVRHAEPELPWVPNGEEWLDVLAAASVERTRTQVMLGLAYDAALRREELCRLGVADIDADRGLLRVRATTSAGESEELPSADGPSSDGGAEGGGTRDRVVPLSPIVAERSAAYLRSRFGPDAQRASTQFETEAVEQPGSAALFLSESPRNRWEPISIWTWSKVVRAIARRAGVGRFTTYTPRHLRLTDLARAGRPAGEIARFAGLSTAALALRYVRLSEAHPAPAGVAGRDLLRMRAEQLARVLFRRHR
jgi:site-specific recombinase XerD